MAWHEDVREYFRPGDRAALRRLTRLLDDIHRSYPRGHHGAVHRAAIRAFSAFLKTVILPQLPPEDDEETPHAHRDQAAPQGPHADAG